MSIEEVSAEQLAELFHHYRQTLGPAESWEQLPPQEKGRMIGAAQLVLVELASTAKAGRPDSRRYFAKPGEAEWGC